MLRHNQGILLRDQTSCMLRYGNAPVDWVVVGRVPSELAVVPMAAAWGEGRADSGLLCPPVARPHPSVKAWLR